MSLRDLAAKTPPGPWRVIPEVKRQGMFAGTDPFVRAADDKTVTTGIRSDECAALIALAPEVAVLCADMADALVLITQAAERGFHLDAEGAEVAGLPALLARFRELEARP